MSVETKISDDGKTLTIKVSGKLDITMYKTFSDSYKDKIGSVSKVILDMADVEHVDSSGLGMMLVLRERLSEDAQIIDIVNVSPSVAKIFKITNYDKLFNIE